MKAAYPLFADHVDASDCNHCSKKPFLSPLTNYGIYIYGKINLINELCRWLLTLSKSYWTHLS